MSLQHCPESPLVKGKPQPCLILPSRNGRVACCWCGRDPHKWHYDELSEDEWPLVAGGQGRTADDVEESASFLFRVVMVCMIVAFSLLTWWAVARLIF